MNVENGLQREPKTKVKHPRKDWRTIKKLIPRVQWTRFGRTKHERRSEFSEVPWSKQ